jgi:hypothetical protein
MVQMVRASEQTGSSAVGTAPKPYWTDSPAANRGSKRKPTSSPSAIWLLTTWLSAASDDAGAYRPKSPSGNP